MGKNNLDVNISWNPPIWKTHE